MTDKNQVAPAEEKKDANGKVNAVTGLPEFDEPVNSCKKVVGSQLMVKLVIQAIGFGIAFAIYYLGSTEKYDLNIASSKGADC
jgi:hypothetical protein